MKISKLIIVLVLASILASVFTYFAYVKWIIIDEQHVPMDINVEDHIGFNLDTDAMHFGISTSPGYAGRAFVIKNNYDYRIEANIFVTGYISDWVEVKDVSFVLEPEMSKEVKLETYVPEDVPFGDYNGTIRIVLKRVIL